MSTIVVLAVVFLVVLFVSAPLRHARQGDSGWSTEVADLEAAREAKYREIRDAELDLRTGKLSDGDFRALDTALRAEALVILRRLDDLRGRSSGPAPTSSP
jgi:hypothetical protein